MIASPILLDLIFLVVFVYTTVMGVKRGLFRSLMELLSYIAALIAAVYFARILTPIVVEWMRPMVTELIGGAISGYLSDAAEESGLLMALLDRLTAAGGFDQMADAAADILIETVLFTLTNALLLMILFVVFTIALRLIIKAGDLVMKLPVLSQLNTVGGLLIGAVNGLLLIGLFLWVQRETGVLIAKDAYEASFLVPYLNMILPL